MSRDPLDGNAIDPASLHKYLYAGGNPVNASDPTGRAMFDVVELDTRSTLEAAAERLAAKAIKNALCYAVEVLWVFKITPYGTNIPNPVSQACWEWANGS